MDERDRPGHFFSVADDVAAEQHRIEDAGERAASDQARTEQRAGADFGFLGFSGFTFDVGAHQTAGENWRGGRNWQIRAHRERQRMDAAKLQRYRDENATNTSPHGRFWLSSPLMIV